MPTRPFERYQAGQLVESGTLDVSQAQANAEQIAAAMRGKLAELQSYRDDWGTRTTLVALRPVLRAVLIVCIWWLRRELADYASAEES